MLLSIGCSTRSWPPAQRLWLRTQQVKLLALRRLRDESVARQERVAAAALRVLLNADLVRLVLPALHLQVAALSRVCHALRSAAELETERSVQHDLVWCSICRRRVFRHKLWWHEHCMCRQCMLEMIDTMPCNAWAEWKQAWKHGYRRPTADCM